MPPRPGCPITRTNRRAAGGETLQGIADGFAGPRTERRSDDVRYERHRPDIVIVMTDEERATPPYETAPADCLAQRNAHRQSMVRRARRQLRSPLHRLAGLRAEPADDLHRAVPGSARRHPDRRHRQGVRRFPAALAAPRRGADAGQLVPRRRLRHPLRRQVAHHPRRPHRPGDRRTAGHQRRRRRRRPRRGAAATSTPIRSRPYGFSGWVGPEPHGAAAVQRGCPPRPADRRPRRRMARGPLRPAPRRRRRRACARSCWSRASSTRTTSCCSRPGRDAVRCKPSPLDPPHVPPAPTADEDLADQARRADRLPRGLLLRLRPSAGDRAGSTSATHSTTATCTTGCTPRSTPRSTGCAAPSPTADPTDAGAGAHRRPRRPARRARRAAPEVVQPLRRGDPRAVRHRPGRRRARRRGAR